MRSEYTLSLFVSPHVLIDQVEVPDREKRQAIVMCSCVGD